MGKTEIVLMITEGEKLDIRILKKLKSIFLPQKEVEIFPICLNIYNLYKNYRKMMVLVQILLMFFLLLRKLFKNSQVAMILSFLN